MQLEAKIISGDSGMQAKYSKMDNSVKLSGIPSKKGTYKVFVQSKNEKLKSNELDFEVCAEIQKDDSGEDTIVVFYVSKEHRDIDPKNIMKVLQARLPHYMIPKSMMRLEQLPISENGKTDKKQLPNIAKEQKNKLARNIVGPRNEKEKQIVSIWQKVLGISEVSIYDNFWDIGGDSIRSIKS